MSSQDHERVTNFGRWRVYYRPGRLPYVGCYKNGKRVLLHRFIMDAPPGRIIDHRNGSRFDNTRENLRWTNSSLNARNAPKYRKRAAIRSVYKGVSWHKRNRTWQAQLHIRERTIPLGYNSCEECCALLYDSGARRYFGSEWSRCNFPEGATCQTCWGAVPDSERSSDSVLSVLLDWVDTAPGSILYLDFGATDSSDVRGGRCQLHDVPARYSGEVALQAV